MFAESMLSQATSVPEKEDMHWNMHILGMHRENILK